MVLWEITLATAYFLGLKRTYRLALRLQRRLVGPNHPKIRHFLHLRTRNAFDIALTVHKNIQQRDIKVGKNLGNRVLRWLDRLKPSAQISPCVLKKPTCSTEITKDVAGSRQSVGSQNANVKPSDDRSNGRVLFNPLNASSVNFSTMSTMVPPRNISSLKSQYRHVSYYTPNSSAFKTRKASLACVFRTDIAQWMLK